jgi:hypothetical protein
MGRICRMHWTRNVYKLLWERKKERGHWEVGRRIILSGMLVTRHVNNGFSILINRFIGQSPVTTKLRCFSPQANYMDRETAACRRSKCQILWTEGAAWSAQRIPTAVNFGFLDPEPLLFRSSSSSFILKGLSGPRSRPSTSQRIW